MKKLDETQEKEYLLFIDKHPRSELAFVYRLGRKKAMIEMAGSLVPLIVPPAKEYQLLK